MDKSKIFKSMVSLIMVGFVTKLLASLAKIIMARNLSTNAMGIYMLVVPVYIFFINVIQLSLPNTIATKIASNPKNTSKIIITSSLIALIVNFIFMIAIIASSTYIANGILKNPDTRLSLISLALLVPLISLGGLIKGYYMGIGKVEITAYSQVSEEIARIIFIIVFMEIFKNKGDAYLAYGSFLSLSASEIFSLCHMIFKLPNFKNKPKLFLKGIRQKENYVVKDILNTAIPLTGGRLISTVAYSLEPIIMTTTLVNLGYSSSYITSEYGIISGLVFPLLLLPGFFASALAKFILQPLTKAISSNKYVQAKKLIISILTTSFLIGLFFSFVMMIFPDLLMNLLYGSSIGSEYVKTFALPFVLYYIESPLISVMIALNKTKRIMTYETIVSIIRLVTLYFLLNSMGIVAIAITAIINSSLLVIFFIIETALFFYKKNKMIIDS